MPVDRKRQVFELLRSLETHDRAATGVINPGKYIQHNLAVADGVAGFAALLAQAGPIRARPVRVFEDGDFVFAHTEYDFFGPKAGFDLFRFEEGRIVEHWDNLQARPAQPNPSGRTLLDGPTEAQDLARTEENKALVRSFLDEVLVGGRFDRLSHFIDESRYHQHNPGIADGLAGLGAAVQAMAAQGITLRYSRVHRVLGEGSFVLAVSEGELAGRHSAFYDLFRLEGGKLVEHWDTIEAIPERSAWKNGNGKF